MKIQIILSVYFSYLFSYTYTCSVVYSSHRGAYRSIICIRLLRSHTFASARSSFSPTKWPHIYKRFSDFSALQKKKKKREIFRFLPYIFQSPHFPTPSLLYVLTVRISPVASIFLLRFPLFLSKNIMQTNTMDFIR